MKKAFAVVLALMMALSVCTFASAEGKDYSGYTIRIYSNSNSTERATWLENAAKEAGFTISMDDNSVISGDTAAIQAANENKDGDIIFGLNETRWSQLVNGTYENLKVDVYKRQTMWSATRTPSTRFSPCPGWRASFPPSKAPTPWPMPCSWPNG